MTKMFSAYEQTNRKTHNEANLIEQPCANSDSESDANPASSTADACITKVIHHISNIADICALEANTPWILKSGATPHVIGQLSLLISIQVPTNLPHRFCAHCWWSDSHCYGIGRTNLTLPFGNITTIRDILYVPGIKKNLLSIGTIANSGAILNFSSNKCYILDEQTHQILAIASRIHASDLYHLDPGQSSNSFKKLRPTQFQQPRQALPSYGTTIWGISIPESCMTCQFSNLTLGFLHSQSLR